MAKPLNKKSRSAQRAAQRILSRAAQRIEDQVRQTVTASTEEMIRRVTDRLWKAKAEGRVLSVDEAAREISAETIAQANQVAAATGAGTTPMAVYNPLTNQTNLEAPSVLIGDVPFVDVPVVTIVNYRDGSQIFVNNGHRLSIVRDEMRVVERVLRSLSETKAITVVEQDLRHLVL